MLFAEGDPLPGWFGVVVQFGSFGLLAYLIVRGLPALYAKLTAERKDEREAVAAERKDEREATKTERTEFLDSLHKQRADHVASLAGAIANFRQESSAERAACEKHFEALAAIVAKGTDATIATIRSSAEQLQQHAARNEQWSRALQTALETAQKKVANEG